MKSYPPDIILNNRKICLESKAKVLPRFYFALLLLTTIALLYNLLASPITQSISYMQMDKCNISSGQWVPNPDAPYYTNTSCSVIYDKQNCMKFGRPDTDFIKWRWKPNDCDLPIFDASQFLEIVRGKSMAFLGDSVSRNHMESLICLLQTVYPFVDVSSEIRSYFFPTHKFTISNFWSPHLVRSQEVGIDSLTHLRLFELYLDEPDKNWTYAIEKFDYVIVSVGHWFFAPTMFYQNNQLVGCNSCNDPNVTDLTWHYSLSMAFRTTFRVLNNLDNFKGTVFLRTFSPGHFENAEWNKGGNCPRTKPFLHNEMQLDGFNLEVYTTQLEEFKTADDEGRKKGVKYRLLDVTSVMLLRPDGHPNKYGDGKDKNLTQQANDCVHWCLPGPADTWNDFLLRQLKTS